MLWLKAWLETRSRLAFVIIWSSIFMMIAASGRPPQGAVPLDSSVRAGRLLNVLAMPWILAPLMLAGAGVRTQNPNWRASKGLHGSTHFTLSLPVSRSRLLFVRAATGYLEMAAAILGMHVIVWVFFPVLRNFASLDIVAHLLTVLISASAFYGVSVLLATILDDYWHMMANVNVSVLVWLPPIRAYLPDYFNLTRPMADASPLITHSLPWTALLLALVIGTVCLTAAQRIVERQEY